MTKVFLAGATGAIGKRPQLHFFAATTIGSRRSERIHYRE
jgi:hypothetical protein